MRYVSTVRYCPTARNFCRLRRILVETLGLSRQAVRLSSTLADLIPPHERWRIEQHLRKEGVKAFDLRYSPQRYVLGWLEIEHIVPRAAGGSDEEDNLWLGCRLHSAMPLISRGATPRRRTPLT